MRPAHLILRADDLRQVDLLGIAAQENLRRAAHPRTAASDGSGGSRMEYLVYRDPVCLNPISG